MTVLPRLTAEDLKDLGVGFVGHRRKLLDAIAALRAQASAPTPPLSDAPLQSTKPPTTPPSAAKSRSCSATLSVRRHSPPVWTRRTCGKSFRPIRNPLPRQCAAAVGSWRNTWATACWFTLAIRRRMRTMRNGPCAGLELIGVVVQLMPNAPLQTRVGIATGFVVVGDLIGSGEAQERGIIGETPNLAARLQGIAEPNMVVIAEATRRLLGNLFELEDLGAKDLKGIAGPARAWAALRASSVEGRFEALHTTGLTALVGREEELELLLRRWSRAKSGEGQVVLLSGEAGIGKSRLTAALLERLAAEPHTRLRYFCSPQHADSAFHPIIDQMERAAGLAYDDKPQARLAKLDALLAQTSTSTQDAALFAEMLSLPNDGRYPVQELSPEQRRQRTLEALMSQLAGLARQNPVLMIFEDAHWVDPTSLEALGRTVHRIKTLSTLLIVTSAPSSMRLGWDSRM